jgi:hypothetical protein
MERTSRLVEMSKTLTRLSALPPAARYLPSGEMLRLQEYPALAAIDATDRPVETSQMRTMPSYPLVAKSRPSRLHPESWMFPLCPASRKLSRSCRTS